MISFETLISLREFPANNTLRVLSPHIIGFLQEIYYTDNGYSCQYIFIIFIILLCIESFSSTSVLFETISAFGTVGLSTGITSALKDLSKML
ncbi:MAG: hypothetical protein JXJ04_18220 [Spirochaetales bacterium]|nr:hypothetical protein [Spirochaetales bacterium]